MKALGKGHKSETKKTSLVWLHLDEASRIGKFVEKDSGLWSGAQWGVTV